MRKPSFVASLAILFILSCGVEKTDKGVGIPDSTPPAQITDLATSIPTDTSLTLTWTAPGDDDTSGTAAQYDIRFDFTALTDSTWDSAIQPFSLPIPQIAGTPETSLVVGLTPDTTYYFGIKTADEAHNWSTISNIAEGITEATLDTIPPAAITDLRVTDRGYTFIELSWTVPGDDSTSGAATNYDMRYSDFILITNENFAHSRQVNGPPVPGQPASTQIYTVYDLDTNENYCFAIKTADEVPNWSAMSNVIIGSTLPDTTPPAPVTDLRILDTTTTSITLIWTAPGDDGALGDASFYDVRYSTAEITDSNFLNAQRAGNCWTPSPVGMADTIVIANLEAGTMYYCAIKTADEMLNWSALSNMLPAKTENIDREVPAAITDLRVIDASLSSLTLEWTAPGDDGHEGTSFSYDFRISNKHITDIGCPYGCDPWYGEDYCPQEYWCVGAIQNDMVPSSAGLRDTVVITGLAAGRGYYIRMKASDRYHWSLASNEVLGFTGEGLDSIPPAPITDLHVIDSTESTITLAWTSQGDDDTVGRASFYYIRRSTSPITEENFNDVLPVFYAPVPGPYGGEDTALVTGLTDNTLYYFALQAADEVLNWSGLSNVVAHQTMVFVMDTIGPAPITDLEIIDSSLSSLTLSWTAPGDNGDTGTATVYDIRFSRKPITDWGCEGNCFVPFSDNWCSQEFRCVSSISDEPTPSTAGTRELFVVNGFQPLTEYYLRIKTADDKLQWSSISNEVHGTTRMSTDAIPPATINDLNTSLVRSTSVELSWTAVGDDSTLGMAAAYDIRYSPAFEVTEQTWDAAVPVVGEPNPQQYGAGETCMVDGLQPLTTYHFAIKAIDDEGHGSALSNQVSARTTSRMAYWYRVEPRGSSRSVVPTNDGGCIVVGGLAREFLARRVDNTGDIVWTNIRRDMSAQESEYRSVTAIPGGGYVAFGRSAQQDFMSYVWTGILTMFDENGHDVWWNYADNGSLLPTSISPTADGGFILVGNRFLIKADAEGNGLWSSSALPEMYVRNDGLEEENRGYLIVGQRDDDAYLAMFDLSGNEKWTKDFGGDGNDCANTIIPISLREYLIAGVTESFGSGMKDVYLISIDTFGGRLSVLRESYIGGGGDDEAYGITATSDGNYVIAGTTTSYGGGGSDMYLIKVNQAGTVLWERTIGGVADDGALYIVGWTKSYGYGEQNAYIIKTDANGEL